MASTATPPKSSASSANPVASEQEFCFFPGFCVARP